MNKFILTTMVALFSFAAAESSFAQRGTNNGGNRGTPHNDANKGGNKDANKGGNKEQRAEMTPAESATKATERMTKRYALDAKQASQIKDINLAFTTEMQGIKAQGKEGKANALPARDRHSAAVKAVLTAEQNTKFDADLAEAKAKQEARRAEREANGGKGGNKGGNKGGAKPPKADNEGDIYEILDGK